MLERRWWGFVVLCHFVSYFEIHDQGMEINRRLVLRDVVVVLSVEDEVFKRSRWS